MAEYRHLTKLQHAHFQQPFFEEQDRCEQNHVQHHPQVLLEHVLKAVLLVPHHQKNC